MLQVHGGDVKKVGYQIKFSKYTFLNILPFYVYEEWDFPFIQPSLNLKVIQYA